VLAVAGCEADSTGPVAADSSGAATEAEELPAHEAPAAPRGKAARVERVIDGDTIALRDGRHVRLVQIDTPETGGECYAEEATQVLRELVQPGRRVLLERDPALDGVDRYGRLLRYVHRERDGLNVNLALVRRGAASVWFYQGGRGRYANELLAAARGAQRHGRGAWGACRARLDPTAAFETHPRG
jgi:endonuclease YncB( thermonuclease family)